MVDRSWFEVALEEANVELNARERIEEINNQRAEETRAKIAEDKAAREKLRKRKVLLSKMHPVSYWSELLGVPDESVRIWCKTGKLQGQWLRKEWRITETAMEEFLVEENKRRACKF